MTVGVRTEYPALHSDPAHEGPAVFRSRWTPQEGGNVDTDEHTPKHSSPWLAAESMCSGRWCAISVAIPTNR